MKSTAAGRRPTQAARRPYTPRRSASESRRLICESIASAGGRATRRRHARRRASPARRPRSAAVSREIQSVAEHDGGLGGQRAPARRSTQHAIPAEQVAPAEPAVAALPGRAVPMRGRAEVHADGIRGADRAPAGGAESQREIEVLVVGEDRLVEPADLRPGAAPVRGGGAGGPGEQRMLVAGVLDRDSPAAGGSRPASRRPPGRSCRSCARPAAASAKRPSPTVGSASSGAVTRARKSGRQSTSLLSSTITSPVPACTPRLQASAKPRLSAKPSRWASGHSAARRSRVSSVEPLSHDDQVVRERLGPQVAQAAVGQVVAG